MNTLTGILIVAAVMLLPVIIVAILHISIRWFVELDGKWEALKRALNLK